jgi:hypothetical protein
MQPLDVKEMESSSKIDLRDVSWWKSIKDVYKPKVSVTTTIKRKVHLFNYKRKAISHYMWA